MPNTSSPNIENMARSPGSLAWVMRSSSGCGSGRRTLGIALWRTSRPQPKRGFAEFPADEQLAKFDPSDRKFVAVALAADDAPPILNASDTDWWLARDALGAHGLTVKFLCPELMAGAER